MYIDVVDVVFCLEIRRPPRSTLFPSRRSSDLLLFQAALFERPFLIFALLSTGTIGFAAVGTLFAAMLVRARTRDVLQDRKSTRLNSSHMSISYAVFCLKKKMFLRWQQRKP